MVRRHILKSFTYIKPIGLALLGLVWLPITLLGVFLLSISVIGKTRHNAISVTAYIPLAVRWILHETGKREDEAAARLIKEVPGVSGSLLSFSVYPVMNLLQVANIQAGPLAYPVYQSAGGSRMVNHRTAFFDEAVKKYASKVSQVVILGAGWGSRAYGPGLPPGMPVFEVDRHQMIRQKSGMINSSGLQYGNIRYVGLDLNRQDWIKALSDRGYDSSRKSLVIMEGVLPYLYPTTIATHLRSAATSLASGSIVVFDYLSEEMARSSVPHHISKLFGEPWRWGIELDEPLSERVNRLVEDIGMQLLAHEVHGEHTGQKTPNGGLVVAEVL